MQNFFSLSLPARLQFAFARFSRSTAIALGTLLLLITTLGIAQPALAANSLGLSSETVQANLEQLGFQFNGISDKVITAKSSDGFTSLRLNVANQNISGAALTIDKPLKGKRRAKSVDYMRSFLQVMVPNGEATQAWLDSAVTDAISYGTVDLIEGDRRIFLLIPRNQDKLLLAVDPLR